MASGNDNLDAADALRAKIFKILTGKATPERAFLSYAPGGLPQSKYTLDFLTNPDMTEQWFDFSKVVNSVPMGIGDWSKSSVQMADLYTHWLDEYVPGAYTISPGDKKKLDEAEAFISDRQNYKDYREYQGKYQNANSVWFGLKVMPTSDRPKNYGILLKQAKDAMDQAEQDWNILGQKAEFNTNYAIVQDLSQRDPVNTKQKLKDKLGSPLYAPQGDFYPTTISPANLLEDGFEWPRFSFYHNEIHEYDENSSVQWGGKASYDSLLWTASAETEGETKFHKHKTDISNMKVEFDLLRAPIIRPWFSNFLLAGTGWKWSTSTPEDPSGGDPLSDGKIPPKQGNWGMIPTEAIFVRNLTVKLDMQSSENQESFTKTKSSVDGGFGPFKIRGHVETENGTEQYDFVEEGDGITCSQPQILGFFCELMPKEPNPNWKLWPSESMKAAGS